MSPCPPCSITWRCLVAPKFNILRQPNRRARTVAAVPPLRRSQARHPPDVMITRFCPASLTPPRPRSSPLIRPPAGRPLPSTGVGTTAATARTAGEIRIVANDFDGPNGLAFSLNETRLYIAEIENQTAPSPRQYIRVFNVGPDAATLSGGDIFHKIEPGYCDGMPAWTRISFRARRLRAPRGDGAAMGGRGLAKLAVPRAHRCPWPKCLPHDWRP
jgi:hypothetical protein